MSSSGSGVPPASGRHEPSTHQGQRRSDDGVTRGLPERRFRPEVHGLRGLAILGVVLFHVFGQGRVSGGIDVFLAISGFLFTGMLLREAATSGGRIHLGRYLGRLATRILPPALFVALVVGVAGYFLFAEVRHDQLAREVFATVLYFENFELINSQLAYKAAGPLTSPLQHYWALSVQGQFFLIWPLVAVAAVWLASRFRASATVMMARLTMLVLLVSFGYALWMRSWGVDVAYLHTGTRMWELAFGGMLALVISGVRLPARLRGVTGWVGIALLVSCGFVLDGAEAFPGPWALWPLMALVLVMISATPDGDEYQQPGRWSAERWLRTAPMTWIGDLAYTLYLWHWPVLIFYLEARNQDQVGLRGAAGVIALSFVLAMVTHRLLERPLMRWRRVGFPAVIAAAAAMAVAAAGPLWWTASMERQRDADLIAANDLGPEYPGALATLPGADPVAEVEPQPSLAVLRDDLPEYTQWPCRQVLGDEPGSDEVLICDDPSKPENPVATILLAGGSHAGHWQPTFQALGEQNDWEILMAIKSGCQLTAAADYQNQSCQDYNAGFVDAIEPYDVDAVFTIGSTGRGSEFDHLPIEFVQKWEEFDAAGVRVIGVRDNPRMDDDVPECLERNDMNPTPCGRPRDEAFADGPPWEQYELPDNVTMIDLTDQYCGPDLCKAVIGNIVVYRDRHHLSSAYAKSLVPIVDERLREKAPDLYR